MEKIKVTAMGYYNLEKFEIDSRTAILCCSLGIDNKTRIPNPQSSLLKLLDKMITGETLLQGQIDAYKKMLREEDEKE